MTDAFDTRAREIACGEPLCFGDDETGHSSTCDMWVRSISSALREADREATERAAVAAWNVGIKLNGTVFEAREVGAAAASAIRGESK